MTRHMKDIPATLTEAIVDQAENAGENPELTNLTMAQYIEPLLLSGAIGEAGIQAVFRESGQRHIVGTILISLPTDATSFCKVVADILSQWVELGYIDDDILNGNALPRREGPKQ